MKYRQGFVSNSSTSSFCIYGVTQERFRRPLVEHYRTELEEIFKEAFIEEDFDDDYTFEDWVADDFEGEGFVEIIDGLKNFPLHTQFDGEEYLVGFSPGPSLKNLRKKMEEAVATFAKFGISEDEIEFFEGTYWG